MSIELEIFYSVFNERTSDLSINTDNGSLKQSVRQDGSSAEYTATEFHEISRLAAQELGEILRQYETEEIVGNSNPGDSKQVRLPVEGLDSVIFFFDSAGISFDGTSTEVRDYLINTKHAFDKVWALIDSVIRLERKTDIEFPDRQKYIAEDRSLIDFIKNNALIPFIQSLRECKLIKEEDFINLIAKMANSTADMRAHSLGHEAKETGIDFSSKFTSDYQAIMKEVFGDDVKLVNPSK